MKKILATILALVMAIGVTTMAWATEPVAEKEVKTADELSAAINGNGDLIKVKLGESFAADVVIPTGKTVTIDLNGKTLTNNGGDTITVQKGATLIINGSGTVDNVTHGKAAIVNNGTATLNGGTYTRSLEDEANNKDSAGKNSYYTILTDKGATMTINAGVTVINVGHFSSMIRNGGTGTDVSTLTINGGTFSGGINTVKNDEAGELFIYGGNFSNTSQYVVMNWNKTTIDDGTFETLESAEAVLFTSNWGGDAGAATSTGTLTINGGTFERASDSQKMIETAYDYDNEEKDQHYHYTGTASISGGKFDANVSAYAGDTAVASLNGTYYVGTTDIGKAVESMGAGDTLTVVNGTVKIGNSEYTAGGNATYTVPPRYYYNSTTTTDTKKDDNKGTSPKTFDAGVGIYAVSAVLSVTGMAYVGKKKF